MVKNLFTPEQSQRESETRKARLALCERLDVKLKLAQANACYDADPKADERIPHSDSSARA